MAPDTEFARDGEVQDSEIFDNEIFERNEAKPRDGGSRSASGHAPPPMELDASRQSDTSHSSRASTVSPGRMFGGVYRLDRIVRSEPNRIVGYGVHLELGREVLITSLTPDGALDSRRVARFLRRARTLARIQNPHAVRILDVGRTSGGRPYAVLEAIDGWDLDEVLRVRGPLPVAEAVDYVVQACGALAEAQVAGAFQLTLNPECLVLSRRTDGSAFIRVHLFELSDHGDADGFSPESFALEQLQDLAKVVPFLSPEQIRSTTIPDARSAVWSLGSVLYTLLVGSPPFYAETALGMLAAVVADRPRPVSELRDDCPPELEAIIQHCLEKEAPARFASIQEVAARLAPFGYADTLRSVDRADRPAFGSVMPPPLPVPRNRSLVPVALGSDSRRPEAVARAPASRWGVPALVGASAGCLAALAVGGWSAHGSPADLPAAATQPTRAPQPLVPASQVAAALVPTELAPTPAPSGAPPPSPPKTARSANPTQNVLLEAAEQTVPRPQPSKVASRTVEPSHTPADRPEKPAVDLLEALDRKSEAEAAPGSDLELFDTPE